MLRKGGAKQGRATKPTPPVAEQETTERKTKKDQVLALLQRERGATLTEIMNVTGWQAHSVRGFISGTVRKTLGLSVAIVERADKTRAYQTAAS